MTDEESLMSQVRFGIEVESFVNTEIGKYLLSRADMEVESAVEKLKTADPDASKQIRDLQNQIYRAESINRWLAEAVQDGFHAERTLTGE